MSKSNHEDQILLELFKENDGLTLKKLKRSIGVADDEFEKRVDSLVQNELCTRFKKRYTITTKGSEHLIHSFTKDISITTNKKSIVEEKFSGRKININEFYIPQKFEK